MTCVGLCFWMRDSRNISGTDRTISLISEANNMIEMCLATGLSME